VSMNGDRLTSFRPTADACGGRGLDSASPVGRSEGLMLTTGRHREKRECAPHNPRGTRWVTGTGARKRRTSRGHRHHGGPWSTATAKETPIANVGVAVRRRVERELLTTENKPAKVAMDRMNPTP
jgi:hypothetical protein